MNRSAFIAALVATLFAGGLSTVPAFAQDYPNKPIRLVIPFPAGGSSDGIGRQIADKLGPILKQSVVVENKGGAGGMIGGDAVAKSPPDGYTLVLVDVFHTSTPIYTRKMPYDAVKDFTPLGLAASAPVAVVVNAATPHATLADLIAAARREPGSIAYGSAGNGTPGHLTGEMFAKAAGIQLKHIPYKGSSQAVTDLLGGQIPLMFDPVQSVLAHVASGKLRALAVSSRQRSPVLAQVPTLDEAGLKGFEAIAWWAGFAPANLPAPVACALATQVERIVRSDAFREQLGNLGVLPAASRLPFAEFQRAEMAKWGQAVRDSGASLD